MPAVSGVTLLFSERSLHQAILIENTYSIKT
jgi:hypothetical protein